MAGFSSRLSRRARTPDNNFTTFSSPPGPRWELVPGLQMHPGPFGVVKPENFVIDGIEVTQAIQCFDQFEGDTGQAGTKQVCSKDNALSLASGKPAVVRVYGATDRSCHILESVASVRVDLHMTWDTGSKTASTNFKVPCTKRLGAFPDVSVRREGNAGTANFYVTIPQGYNGKVRLWAQINPDQTWPEPNYSNNRYPATGTEDVEFQTRKPLSIGYVLVDYQPKPSHDYRGFKIWKTSKPDPKWAASTGAYGLFDAIYPSGSLSYQKFGTGQWTYTGPDVRDNYTDTVTNKLVCGECELLNHLTKQWQASKGSGKSPPDQIFAWLPEDARAPLGAGVADAPPPPYTGQGRAALGEEKRYQILAHEVGHNLKLFHAPCQSNQPKGVDPDWPYADGLIQEVGFDATGRTRAANSADIMSYCPDRWISPYHWKKLFDALAPSSTMAATSSAELAIAQQSYALISGLLSDDDIGQLDPLIRLESNAEPSDLPAGGDYCLTFHDASESPLATYCFDLSFVHPESGEPGSVTPFAFALPYPAGATRVALLHGETLLDERVASANAPEVSITSPGGGESWDGIQTVAWSASDVDGDDMTFSLFYSFDDGENWMPIAMDLTQTSFQLDTTSLPGGEVVRIRVLAGDGFHTTTADSPPLSVPTKAPDVSIAAPADNALLLPEQAVYLSGSAHDPEDGLISDVALSWWADREGLLGRGAALIVPAFTLSPGWHTITLRAADNDGQIGQTRVNVFVGHRIFLPLLMR